VQNTSCPEISLWYTCHVGGHKADGKGGKLGFPTFPPAAIPLFQEFQTECMKFLIAFRYNPSLIAVLPTAGGAAVHATASMGSSQREIERR
jgi:hypothetical protein